MITAFQTAVFAIELPKSVHAFKFYVFYLVSNADLIRAIYQFFGGRGVKGGLKAILSCLACCLIFLVLAGVIGLGVDVSYAYIGKHWL